MFGKKTIKELIETRSKSYNKLTTKLRAELDKVVIPACTEFVNSQVIYDVTNKLDWYGFSSLPHDDYPEGILMLVGSIHYFVGDTIVDPLGKDIVLSAQDAALLSSTLNITLPFKIVNKGTKQEIIDFLTYQHLKATQQATIAALMAQHNQDNIDFSKELTGFDLSGLEPDELALARLLALKNGKIIQ